MKLAIALLLASVVSLPASMIIRKVDAFPGPYAISFGAPVSLDADSGALGAGVGDLDGDGNAEFITAASDDSADPHLRIYDWNGSSWDTYNIDTVNGSDQDRFGGDIEVADIDHDGDLDIVLPESNNAAGTGSLWWYANPGSLGGTWTKTAIDTWSGTGTGNIAEHMSELAVADIDGDTWADIVVRDVSHGFWVFMSDGTAGGFETRNFTSTNPREGLYLGDMDLDGDLDVVLNGVYFATPADPVAGTYVETAMTDVDGDWYPATTDSGTIAGYACKSWTVDLDNDGDQDFVITNAEKLTGSTGTKPDGVEVYFNDGDGSYTLYDLETVHFSWHNLAVGDFDLDGLPDIITGISDVGTDSAAYQWSVYTNDGDGTFTKNSISTSHACYQMVRGDADGDGDLDVLIPDNWNDGPIRYYENTSSPDVTAPTLASATINGSTLTLNFDEPVSQGASYSDSHIDVDMTTTGSDIGVTYSSGNGTATWVFTTASAAVNGETVDLDFSGTANSIEDASGNDLAAIVSASVTNSTPSGTYMVDEDFEGAGAPASVVNSNGTPDYDYATSPAPLAGTESFSANSAFEHAEFSFGSTETDVWGYLLINSSNGVDGSTGQIQLVNSSDQTQATIHFDTDRVGCTHGSGADSDLGASNTSTTAVWFHYIAETTPGSSADGEFHVYITKNSSPGTRPAELLTVVNGTGDSIDRIRLTCWNTTNAIIMDNLVVDTSEITGTP